MFNCRKLPIIIQAEEWSGSRKTSFPELKIYYQVPTRKYEIHTLEGWHDLSPGCYILKGVDGEFYPCKKEIFEKTYEKVEE